MNGLPPEITFATREGIAWITFNRPQKANALNTAILQGLKQALDACAADDAVRAVVLTGAGARVFSAGADLTRHPENHEALAAERRASFESALLALVDFGKPTLAAVNGAACGAGMMFALACDTAIAADSARFSLPEINEGLPAFPGIAIVRRRFGEAMAAELVLSGRFMPADEALRRGVVGSVVAGADLGERALELALRWGKKGGRAYAADKQWLNRSLRAEIAEAFAASAQFHKH